MYVMESAGIFLGVKSDFAYLWWGVTQIHLSCIFLDDYTDRQGMIR